MTVAQLKKHLNAMPDSAKVVMSGSDHSYNDCGVELAEAEVFKDGIMVEYYDEDNMSNKRNKIIDVVVIK